MLYVVLINVRNYTSITLETDEFGTVTCDHDYDNLIIIEELHILVKAVMVTIIGHSPKKIHNLVAQKSYFKSMKGTELPSMYWGILPSHFCTAS